MNEITNKQTRLSLFLFLLGLVLTVVIMQIPDTKQLVVKLGQSGIVGSFVAGILYAFAFTSSMATAIFLKMPEAANPVILAIIGGLGAALYDFTVFTIIKKGLPHGWLGKIQALVNKRRMPAWFSLLVGLIILGSPLPDELAAGFFGFFKLSSQQFIALSLIANTVGIFIILSLR